MKIAIVNCLKANRVCAGAACLNAMNRRIKSFSDYEGQDIVLDAFMRCNGCGHTVETDVGMQEKLERIISLQPETVHFGKCTFEGGQLCDSLQSFKSRLEEAGIKVVLGTH